MLRHVRGVTWDAKRSAACRQRSCSTSCALEHSRTHFDVVGFSDFCGALVSGPLADRVLYSGVMVEVETGLFGLCDRDGRLIVMKDGEEIWWSPVEGAE